MAYVFTGALVVGAAVSAGVLCRTASVDPLSYSAPIGVAGCFAMILDDITLLPLNVSFGRLYDNMAQLLARGEVSYDLNSLLAAEMMSVSNRNEKSMLLGKYEDAMARFMVSRLKPEYETLRKAWGFRDFFHAAHQTVCTVSSNHIEGVYFTLKMIALLNAEAENLDAKLMKLNYSAHAQQTYSGPDLSERGCLIVCARGLRDDAKSLVYQYIDMPRHLFDEYTVGCTPREKKKIVKDIETIIGRAPKFF